MGIGSINWPAIVVCVIAGMISGGVWYNPQTFFPVWWKGIGKTSDDTPGSSKGMGFTWTLTILSCLVQAIFMAVAVNIAAEFIGGVSFVSGAAVGFFVWFGVVAPTYLVNKVFSGHSFWVWAIETGNHLVNFVIFGAILGFWR